MFGINRIIAIGMFELIFTTDKLFVNSFGMSFYSGAVFLLIVFVGLVFFAIRKNGRRAFDNCRIAARKRYRRRLRLHTARDVDICEIKFVGALCEQTREHGERRIDAAENDFVPTYLSREIDDDVRERAPGRAHDHT